MTTDQFIVDLAAGIPTILAAITALILAVKGNNKAETARVSAASAQNSANIANARMGLHMVEEQKLTKKVVIPMSESTEPVTPETPKVGQSGASLMGFGNQQGASGPEPATAEPADLGTAETDALSDVAQDVAPVETAVADDVPLVKRLIAQVRQLVDDFEAKHS